jgi:hypothetical protein
VWVISLLQSFDMLSNKAFIVICLFKLGYTVLSSRLNFV